MTMQAKRIDPEQAHERLELDPDAMLVCAYDEPAKFEQYHLEGAVSLDEFAEQADTLARNQEIIFYCA